MEFRGKRTATRRLLTGMLVLASLLGGPPSAWCQQTGNFFLPAPRTLRQHLSRAREAVEQQRYGEAVAELGALLTTDLTGATEGEPQDFFLVEPDATQATSSLKSEAQQLLGSMPARGRELYELQFGADARALLDEAVAAADFERLNAVVRKYFHTDAGYEAMMLLGRLHLDRGQPLAAALCFQRVLDAPAAGAKYDPELSVLLAACWMYADRPTEAISTIDDLRRRAPRAQLRIGEQERVELPAAEGTLAWLRRHFGDALSRSATGASQWLLHRGDPSRNAQSPGGLPLSNFRWQVPTASDPGDESLIQDVQSTFRSQNLPALPSLQPLAVGEVVLMRTPERLLAIDFETGKRIWKYPWWDASYPSVRARRGGSRSQETEQRTQELVQRLWKDAPYGQLASDGNAVYLLDNLRYANASIQDSQWFPRRGPMGRQNEGDEASHNQLVALDLHRQGSLKWIVGGESGTNDPRLANAFFLGPPLPVMGQLYVLAEMNGEIRLLALDPETGHQRWTQQLAHVDTYTVLRSTQRRLAGASPSFANGVLICPTSAGAVVAVDLATRALLWGYQYEPIAAEMSRFGMASPFPSSQQPENHWSDATATVAEGRVLLTPVESNKLICLDLLTGKLLWEQPRQGPLANAQYVAGVNDGRVLVVANHGMVALRLEDGQLAWPAPLRLEEAAGEMPSGRGFLQGRFYFLPTTRQQLLKIDTTNGKIESRTSTAQVLGNLVAFQDQIISQGADHLAAFFQIEPLREVVARRLNESPDDAWALARRGELMIHDGQLPEALEALRRAYQADPQDEAVRSLLVQTLLTALRDDFASHQELAVELEALVERPAQRHEYLRLMATGLHALSKHEAALDAYLELADLAAGSEDTDLSLLPLVEVEDQVRARLDRWLQARLERLAQEADSAIRERLAADIQARWQKVAGQSVAQQEHFLRFFGFHPVAVAAHHELARALALDERWIEAELLIEQLARRHAPGQAVTAAASVADALHQRGKYDMAAAFYRLVGERFANVEGTGGKTGGQLLAAARQSDGPLRQALQAPAAFAYGKAAQSQAPGPSDNAYRRVLPIPVLTPPANGGEQWTVSYDGSGASTILVHDGRGQVMSRTPLDDSRGYYHLEYGVNYARFYGNLLVAVMADQIVAIDLHRGQQGTEEAVRWRDALAQTVPEMVMQNSQKGAWDHNNPLEPKNPTHYFVKDSTGAPLGSVGPLTSRGVMVLKSRTLHCLDLATGQPLWTRENVGRGVDVFGDDEHLFVCGRSDRTATVLQTSDGRALGSRAVPDWDHRWTTVGSRVLAWEPNADGVRLYLYDVWSERELWSEQLPAGTRGDLVQGQAVAAMQPDGRLLVRTLTDQPPLIDTTVEAEPKLDDLYVLASRSDLMIVTNHEVESLADGVSVTPVTGGMPAPLIHGHLYAFDRSTGQQRWQTPAVVENHGLPLLQPTELPTLWFIRQVSTRESRRAPTQSDLTSVLCLDRRDGRLLASFDEVPTRANAYDIVAESAEQAVRMLLPGYTLSVTFSDRPMPPEPPADTGSASDRSRAAGRRDGSVLGAIKELFQGLPTPRNEAPGEGR